MTELIFKGKEFVRNHHLTVPFRPLVPVPEKGIGPVDLSGNLIIHGDNLHALKALLPMYAGKVDVVFIDPPYNTGNEGWAYNDNVNSPMIKEWLNKEVGLDDGLRHDKWCAMMWPRLVMLRELLSDNGSIWITLDDNEVHHAKGILDEVFGQDGFIATIVWHKVYSPKNTAKYFSEDHDYLLVYARTPEAWRPKLLPRTEDMEARYINPDNDARGPWKSSDLTARNPYSKGKYEVTGPTGKKFHSGSRYWRQSYESFLEMDSDNRIWWGEDKSNMPSQKRFLSEVKDGLVPQTIWHYSDAGHTQDAKKEILEIFDLSEDEDIFVTPKPTKLLSRILRIASSKDSVVLDSFAGSATTAHAVMQANAKDQGSRRYICVETEDYADRLTAERMRRVINGYAFEGSKRETLLEEKITFTSLKKADKLLDHITAIENLEGHRFDEIKKEVKDGELIVTGIKKITEKVDGLGGTFTYCELGEAVNLDKILTGEQRPAYEALGAALFHMITNQGFDPKAMDESQNYLGASTTHHVWMLYKPDLAWLKSPDAALTLNRAKAFAAAKNDGKAHYVVAATRYVSDRLLREENVPVDFVPLPYALYRIEKA